MPLFEFECPDCGLNFEELLAAEARSPACPRCGGKNAIKKVGLPGPLKKGAFPFKPGPVHSLAGPGGYSCGGHCPK